MAARNSSIYGSNIEYAFVLVMKADGSLRLTRNMGRLMRDERAMSCTLTVPKTIFQTPSLKAAITLSDAGAAPVQIDVEAAKTALRSALGVDIDLQVKEVP